jgi:hypothetical protein
VVRQDDCDEYGRDEKNDLDGAGRPREHAPGPGWNVGRDRIHVGARDRSKCITEAVVRLLCRDASLVGEHDSPLRKRTPQDDGERRKREQVDKRGCRRPREIE